MTEREVIVELYKSGWQPEEIVLIADASGTVAEQRITAKGGVSAGHSSYDLFRLATHAYDGDQEIVIPAWKCTRRRPGS